MIIWFHTASVMSSSVFAGIVSESKCVHTWDLNVQVQVLSPVVWGCLRSPYSAFGCFDSQGVYNGHGHYVILILGRKIDRSNEDEKERFTYNIPVKFSMETENNLSEIHGAKSAGALA